MDACGLQTLLDLVQVRRFPQLEMDRVVRLVVTVVQIDQVVCPGIPVVDRIVKKGDFVKVPPLVCEQRVVYTEHTL